MSQAYPRWYTDSDEKDDYPRWHTTNDTDPEEEDGYPRWHSADEEDCPRGDTDDEGDYARWHTVGDFDEEDCTPSDTDPDEGDYPRWHTVDDSDEEDDILQFAELGRPTIPPPPLPSNCRISHQKNKVYVAWIRELPIRAEYYITLTRKDVLRGRIFRKHVLEALEDQRRTLFLEEKFYSFPTENNFFTAQEVEAWRHFVPETRDGRRFVGIAEVCLSSVEGLLKSRKHDDVCFISDLSCGRTFAIILRVDSTTTVPGKYKTAARQVFRQAFSQRKKFKFDAVGKKGFVAQRLTQRARVVAGKHIDLTGFRNAMLHFRAPQKKEEEMDKDMYFQEPWDVQNLKMLMQSPETPPEVRSAAAAVATGVDEKGFRKVCYSKSPCGLWFSTARPSYADVPAMLRRCCAKAAEMELVNPYFTIMRGLFPGIPTWADLEPKLGKRDTRWCDITLINEKSALRDMTWAILTGTVPKDAPRVVHLMSAECSANITTEDIRGCYFRELGRVLRAARFHDSEWVKPLVFSRVLVLHALMGMGKTTQIQRFVAGLPNTWRILFLTPRVQLANALAVMFAPQGFKHYKDLQRWDIPNAARLILQVESVGKLLDRNGAVTPVHAIITDETHAVFSQLVSSTHRDKGNLSFNIVCGLFKHCNQAVFAGADMFADQMVSEFLPNLFPSEDIEFHVYTKVKIQREIVFATESEWYHNIELELRSGGNIALIYESKRSLTRDVVMLGKKYPNANILTVTADTPEADKRALFVDINRSLQDVDVFTFTSAITVGVDIQVEFKKLFVHFTKTTGPVQRDVRQMMGRFRHVKDTEVLVMMPKPRKKDRTFTAGDAMLGIMEQRRIRDPVWRQCGQFDTESMKLTPDDRLLIASHSVAERERCQFRSFVEQCAYAGWFVKHKSLQGGKMAEIEKETKQQSDAAAREWETEAKQVLQMNDMEALAELRTLHHTRERGSKKCALLMARKLLQPEHRREKTEHRGVTVDELKRLALHQGTLVNYHLYKAEQSVGLVEQCRGGNFPETAAFRLSAARKLKAIISKLGLQTAKERSEIVKSAHECRQSIAECFELSHRSQLSKPATHKHKATFPLLKECLGEFGLKLKSKRTDIAVRGKGRKRQNIYSLESAPFFKGIYGKVDKDALLENFSYFME